MKISECGYEDVTPDDFLTDARYGQKIFQMQPATCGASLQRIFEVDGDRSCQTVIHPCSAERNLTNHSFAALRVRPLTAGNSFDFLMSSPRALRRGGGPTSIDAGGAAQEEEEAPAARPTARTSRSQVCTGGEKLGAERCCFGLSAKL